MLLRFKNFVLGEAHTEFELKAAKASHDADSKGQFYTPKKRERHKQASAAADRAKPVRDDESPQTMGKEFQAADYHSQKYHELNRRADIHRGKGKRRQETGSKMIDRARMNDETEYEGEPVDEERRDGWKSKRYHAKQIRKMQSGEAERTPDQMARETYHKDQDKKLQYTK